MTRGAGRRYDRSPRIARVPGRQDGLTVQIPKAPGADCTPDWRLVWRATDPSTLTGEQQATGLVGANGFPLGPWGWVAEIQGERCCCVPEWSTRWEPSVEGSEPPTIITGRDGVAVMAGLQDSINTGQAAIGLLTVIVQCGDQSDQVELLLIDGGSLYSGPTESCVQDIGGLAWIDALEPAEDGTWPTIAAPTYLVDEYDGVINAYYGDGPWIPPSVALMTAAGDRVAVLCGDCVVWTVTHTPDPAWDSSFANVVDAGGPPPYRAISCSPVLTFLHGLGGYLEGDRRWWPGTVSVSAHLASDPDTILTIPDMVLEIW